MAGFNDISFVLRNTSNQLVFVSNPNIFSITFQSEQGATDFTTLYNNNKIVTVNGSTITTATAVQTEGFLQQVTIGGDSATIPVAITTVIDGTNRRFFNNILFGPGGNCGSILIENMGFPADNEPPPIVLNSLLTIPDYQTFITYIPGGNGEDELGPLLFVSANPASLTCLLKGTKILTPAGEVLIEHLKINDIVLTADNREVKIMHIHSTLASSENNLYVIRKDKISRGVPNEDLFVSGGHLVKIHDKFYHPFHNKTDLIEKCDENKLVQFYHVKLENYFTDFLIANGIEVESLGDVKNPDHINWDCSGEECKLAAIKQL